MRVVEEASSIESAFMRLPIVCLIYCVDSAIDFLRAVTVPSQVPLSSVLVVVGEMAKMYLCRVRFASDSRPTKMT